MPVKHFGEVWKCKVCGNVVEVVEVGGGTLVCCGKDMVPVEAETQGTVNIPDSGG